MKYKKRVRFVGIWNINGSTPLKVETYDKNSKRVKGRAYFSDGKDAYSTIAVFENGPVYSFVVARGLTVNFIKNGDTNRLKLFSGTVARNELEKLGTEYVSERGFDCVRIEGEPLLLNWETAVRENLVEIDHATLESPSPSKVRPRLSIKKKVMDVLSGSSIERKERDSGRSSLRDGLSVVTKTEPPAIRGLSELAKRKEIDATDPDRASRLNILTKPSPVPPPASLTNSKSEKTVKLPVTMLNKRSPKHSRLELQVCSTTGGIIKDSVERKVKQENIYFGGRAKTGATLQGYQVDATIGSLFPTQIYQLSSSVTENTLITLNVPTGFPRPTRDDGKSIVPVSLPTALISLAEADEDDSVKPRILVVGDAATVAISGLDALGTKFRGGEFSIEWHVPSKNGSIKRIGNFSSFNSLHKQALSNKGGPFFYSNPTILGTFFSSVAMEMESPVKPVSMVIWIKEGQLLPNSTPSIFQHFLKRIKTNGNVERFPSGESRKWLSIIAGQYAQKFSPQYLLGPLRTTPSEVGSMFIEKRPTSSGRRQLLNNPERVFLSLKNILRRLGIEPSEPRTQPDLVFDSSEVVTSLGYLLPPQRIKELKTSLTTYLREHDGEELNGLDPIDLMFPRTGDGFSVKIEPIDLPRHRRRVAAVQRRIGNGTVVEFVETLRDLLSKIDARVEASRDCSHIFIPFNPLSPK